MSVYDKAQELAQAIQADEDYQALLAAGKKLAEDEKTRNSFPSRHSWHTPRLPATNRYAKSWNSSSGPRKSSRAVPWPLNIWKNTSNGTR